METYNGRWRPGCTATSAPTYARDVRLMLASALAVLAVSPAQASVRVGPAGDRFYSPPARLVPGKPGTIVWAREAQGLPALRAAAKTFVVLYRSRSLTGEPIVSSGTIALPRGASPVSGWPVVSWFHVTTGSGDSCAPSRATADNPEVERMTRADTIASRLLVAGAVVARPDGEGIGTPGGHPYLIGRSLARSQSDMVRAARALDARVGRRWLAAGHSEGGVATLSSAAYGRTLAPELELRGASAFSPVTRMREQVDAFSKYAAPGPPGDGLSALASLIITGAGEADPELGTLLRAGGLSEEAEALLPDVEDRCLVELGKADSWGGLAPADIPGPEYESRAKPRFYKVLEDNDVRNLDLHGLPIRIDHGSLDAVAPAPFTREMAEHHRSAGADVLYTEWPTATHVDITGDGQAGPDAARWMIERLGTAGEPKVTCRIAPASAAIGRASLRRGVLRFRAHRTGRLRVGPRRLRVEVCRRYRVRLEPGTRRIRVGGVLVTDRRGG